MSQFSWSIIGLGDSDDDNTLQIEGLTPAIGTVADASAAIGAAADVALSARAPAALGGVTGPADTNTKQEEKPTVAASALVARGLLAVVPTAKRTRTAVETLDEHRLHRLWWFDIVPVTLRMRAQNSSVSLCFPDTEPENIDGWLPHCNRIIRRWSPSSFYYIGITADPVRRFLEGHSRNGHGGYDIMDVIAAVASSKESARIERGLLARHRAPLLREHRAGWREPHSRPSSLRVRRRSHRPYAKPPLRKQSQAASNNGVRHGFFWLRLARFVSSAAFVHVSR